jgi:putative flippase GtrA
VSRSAISLQTKRYLIIGISIYLLEVLVITAAQKAGLSSVVAVGIGFWVGLLASFLLQKIVTFGDKRYQHKVIISQFLLVCLLVAWNFIFTLGLTALLQSYLPAFICRALALGITTIWNFYLYKVHIFKSPQDVM